jgi:anti-sigma-K factor RskA
VDNIKEFIESGILELYVMGDLSPDESQEVELMAEKHPAIKQELLEIETAMEVYANATAVAPKDSLRDKIINSVNAVETSHVAPETKVVSLRRESNNGFYKIAFAASVAILLISWAALFLVYNKLQNSQEQIASLQGSNRQFANRVNYFNKQLESSKTEISVLRSPDFKFVKLQGTKNAPDASILVAFNPKQKEVMLDLASVKMPENDKQHQYQLWALVDGKPVDLGVFDASADTTGMIRMKELSNAQAFAVTLEPRGGSANPTMEQMMVMGAISI